MTNITKINRKGKRYSDEKISVNTEEEGKNWKTGINEPVKTFEPKSNTWIYLSILSAFLFALSNFCQGRVSHSPQMAREFILATNLIYGIGYFGYKIFAQNFSSRENSNTENYKLSDSTGNVRQIASILLSSFLCWIGGYFTLYAFKYSTWAGINHGIISTCFSFTTIFTSISTWMKTGEKLSKFHITGISVMLLCISMLGFSKHSPKASKYNLV